MTKPDPVIVKNIIYIAVVDLILSIVMQSAFAFLGGWDVSVLLGNVLGYVASVANFSLLCFTVQRAVNRESEDAKKSIAASQRLRLLLMLGVAVIGYAVKIFNPIAVVIPFLFNGVAVFIRSFIIKEK